MGLMNMASSASLWRGYAYFQSKKVLAIEQINESQFHGSVAGNQNHPYDVLIDIEHPRKSHCNCPLADGRRIICKHMIALYFTALPQEAADYYKKVIAYEEEQERLAEETEARLVQCIKKMRKAELQNALIQLLEDGPEWQYDDFVDTYVDWKDDDE